MATIAFIGLGNMGGPMAANLVKAGHKVVAFDLVADSRDQARADGAAIAESSVASVKGADVVITMLPAGKHVLSVWNEVVPAMTKGTLIIDCSTIDVESSKQAHALAAKHGVASVDAPVSGGTGGAKGATLTFMCGGDDEAFTVAKPVLEKISKDWAEAQKSPDMQAKIKGQFMVSISDTPEAMIVPYFVEIGADELVLDQAK